MKKCAGCKQQKLRSEFHRRTAASDGLVAACKKCVRERADTYIYGSARWRRDTLSRTKSRAARKQIPFDELAVRELLVDPPEVCAALNFTLRAGGGGSREQGKDAATIDRRVPRKGYVRGNMDIISRRANNIKSDATAAEIRAVADWLELLEDVVG